MSGRPPAVLLERAVAVAEIVVQLHEAQRGKAVEPGVGHRLQGVGKAVALDAAHEAFALLADLGGPFAPGDHHHVALALGGQGFELPAVPRGRAGWRAG
jgi:hypothetical protein